LPFSEIDTVLHGDFYFFSVVNEKSRTISTFEKVDHSVEDALRVVTTFTVELVSLAAPLEGVIARIPATSGMCS
jgi:hypothetical protein